MPTSEKRVAANRANAAKSTGSRTPEGKEKSKLNATLHGLTAQTAVLPGEDRGELEALSRSLMGQLSPRGVVQRLIAERVVSLAWKLRRVARAEEAIAAEMDAAELKTWNDKIEFNANFGYEALKQGARPKGRDAGALLAASFSEVGAKNGEGRLIRLTQYELKLDAALRSAVRELRSLQREDDFDAEDGAIDVAGETREAETPEVVMGENEPTESHARGNFQAATADPTGEARSGAEGTLPAASPARVANPCHDDAPRGKGFQPVQAARDVISATATATTQSETANETDRVDQTNPTREPDAPAAEAITRVFPSGNSSPVPRTSSSPPPEPRR